MKAKDIAARLVSEEVEPLVADPVELTLGLDDTPTPVCTDARAGTRRPLTTTSSAP